MNQVSNKQLKRLNFLRNAMNLRWPFGLAWFVTIALVGLIENPRGLGGFSCGLQVGFAWFYFMNRRQQESMRRARMQDPIDLRTMSDLVENMSYKMLHQIDKAPFN